MAWTAPMTAVENEVWHSSDFNTHVRDNLLQTAPAVVSGASKYLIGTAANALSNREALVDTVITSEPRLSATYGDLATPGPAVTATTGTRALVFFRAQFNHQVDNTSARLSVAVSGATTIAANDDWCLLTDGRIANNNIAVGTAHMFTGLTPGSNTFTMKYNASNGVFTYRVISVLPL